VKERKDRVDDALHATTAASEATVGKVPQKEAYSPDARRRNGPLPRSATHTDAKRA